MIRTVTICGILFIAGVIGVLSYGASKNANVQAPPAETTPKRDEAKEISGKYLVVHEKPGGKETPVIPLTDPETKVLRGHAFLVGKIVAPNDLWKQYEGKTLWVSMDNICEVFECNDLDQLKGFWKDDDQSTSSSTPPSVKEERYLNFNSPNATDPQLLDGKALFTPLQNGTSGSDKK